MSLQSDSCAFVDVRMKLQLPYPEHALGQALDNITQYLEGISHLSQGLQSVELVQATLDCTEEALESCSIDAEGMHAELLSPSSPTKLPPPKHGQQVCEVVEQGDRLILKQFGASVQLAEFNTELMVEIACFILSALPAALVSCPTTSPCNADWLTCMRDTATSVMADAFELRES